ncbi:hypothetical protein ScPMuIL_009411 [Solemya velum]
MCSVLICSNERNDGTQTDTEGHQKILYYEVALGTDRRFANTQNNVYPFTNVGVNESVTFYNLNLIPEIATYYFTVRAYSTSNSVVDVTSNGFQVTYDGGVSGGSITMGDYINSNTIVGVLWSGFESKLELMLSFVALSNNTDAINKDCKLYVEGGGATEREKALLFNVYSMTNVGKDTYVEITGLTLTQGEKYYAWVIVMDQLGACQMVVHEFTVDISPPDIGRMRAGIHFDMAVSYTQRSDTIGVWWENYKDPQSGIRSYEVSLRKYSSCAEDDDIETVVDWLTLDPDYTEYTFVDLKLQPLTPHHVHLRVSNWAGLSVTETSAPVLYDPSEPTQGRVVDGDNFQDDLLWLGQQHSVKGVILHLADPTGPPCPLRQISVYSDPGWKSLIQKGAYIRNADFVNDITYQVNVKAAGGQGKAVTGIMFWDGPEDGIAVFNYLSEDDWTADLCACCTDQLPDAEVCLCNCTEYLATKEFYDKLREDANIAKTEPRVVNDDNTGVVEVSENPWDVFDPEEHEANNPVNTSIPLAQRSCGIQLYSGKPTWWLHSEC